LISYVLSIYPVESGGGSTGRAHAGYASARPAAPAHHRKCGCSNGARHLSVDSRHCCPEHSSICPHARVTDESQTRNGRSSDGRCSENSANSTRRRVHVDAWVSFARTSPSRDRGDLGAAVSTAALSTGGGVVAD
jgi:hypothetical protein